MKKLFAVALIIGGIWAAAPAAALPEATWKNPLVKLGEAKAKVLELLGTPDSVDSGTDIYAIPDSKDLLMVMAEYRQDVVCVLAEIYKPTVTVKTLVDKLKTEKHELLTDEADGTVFFAGPQATGHYIVVSPSEGGLVGPTLAKMTPQSFADLEVMEPAAPASAPVAGIASAPLAPTPAVPVPAAPIPAATAPGK
jgi:hypothetical protein